MRRRAHAASGPIPARAGQPLGEVLRPQVNRAYPRSRGATTTVAKAREAVTGLSPLARGNRQHWRGHPLARGPIPARAGQPAWSRSSLPAPRAYPRSRGATVERYTDAMYRHGLSPLARGNRGIDAPGGRGEGPIPARAGQPMTISALCHPAWAYPRSRGATGIIRADPSRNQGLSPLARGNQGRPLDAGVCTGPIPARAGQPGSRC